MAIRRLQYFRELITCRFVLITALWLGSASGQQPSAVDQGKTLKSLAADWGVRFPAWEIDPDPCASNWTYVTCDKATSSRVTKLVMQSVNLTGSIPKAIGELVYLEQLDLTNNSLVDPIPVEIGKLVRLQQLILNRNLFASVPPDALLNCNLTRLQMNRNKITGQLPVWISQMTTLSHLDFNSNEMWGGLPPEYGNLVGLTSVQLWENGFSGYMPDSWRNLVNVKNYGMGHLYMTGPIPEWIFELPKLQTVNFMRNQFIGPFPNLTQLLHNGIANFTSWNFMRNQFIGPFPNLTQLLHNGIANFTSWNFMRNQFIGPFPNLTQLLHNGIANFTSWDFHCNYLQGDYPVGYYNVLPVPSTVLNYTNNCFNNETDGSATINNSPNATQNTPLACGRTYNCPDFYAAMKVNGNCAPCPPSQFITNHTNCVCGKDLPSSKSETPVGAIVGGVIGGIVATVAVSALFFFLYLKKNRVKYPQFGRKLEGLDDPWTVPKELNRFTLQDLEKATDNFSEEFFIGKGGFGKVYRGNLIDGKTVAIKCASTESAQGQAEFRNELALLSRLHHRHLVGLEGFCDEDGYQILVYEFMSNGDLHDNLLGKNGSTMNATQRLEVAVGIARGLDYLHTSANPPVIHRDVKPSNVLLDDFMVAKLADFGISKVSPELYTHVSTRPLGTAGYMDPDYFRTNQLTVASDVYAFGVVMLELVTGQRVFDASRIDAVNLNEWVRPRFAIGGITDIIDERLGEDYDADLFTILTEIGLSCSKDRWERPSMKEVLNLLEPHVAKAMKESVADPKWSTSHFKNKSLFEENGKTPRSTDSSGNNTVVMPTPSSGTSSGTNTVTFDAFTALQPR